MTDEKHGKKNIVIIAKTAMRLFRKKGKLIKMLYAKNHQKKSIPDFSIFLLKTCTFVCFLG